MSAHSAHLNKAFLCASAMIVAGLTMSCASTHYSAPRQVDASRPTVTYQYHNDDELIQANQRAIGFCEPYQSLPRAQSFSNDSEHNRIVVFECVSNLPVMEVRQPDSNLRYDYRTDQELLEVSRNAQVYCRNSGKPDMSSAVVVHADGSRSVTFHCGQS